MCDILCLSWLLSGALPASLILLASEEEVVVLPSLLEAAEVVEAVEGLA